MSRFVVSWAFVAAVGCFRPALPQDVEEADGADVSWGDSEIASDIEVDNEPDDGAVGCTKDEDCSWLDSGCSFGFCSAGACALGELEGQCDDGDSCTTGDRCLDGSCSGEAVVCAALPCMFAACDPLTGGCVQTALDDGSECDDAEACTVGDFCSRGHCVSGGPPDDRADDWHTVFQSASSVSVGGVAAVDNGVIVAVSVGGGNPLNIARGEEDLLTVNPSLPVSQYIVVARLDHGGNPEWARVVMQLPGEPRADQLLAIRGGPFVHSGSAITLGYMTTESAEDELRTTIGILRLGPEGSEVWRRTVSMAYPEPADFSFGHVCASPGGRVAVGFPALQDGLGSFQVLATRDEQLVDELTMFSSAGLSSGVVTWSVGGELEHVGWVRSDAEEAFSLGCAVRDDGSVVTMGFAKGDTLIAEATSSSDEIRQGQLIANEQFAWAAAFSAGGLPTAVAIAHSTLPAAENGLSTGYGLENGVILGGLFQGAVSVVSSEDGTLRSLQGQDPGVGSSAPMAAVLELDRGLRLRAGTRIEAGELSWIQTISASQGALTVAGGGRDLALTPASPEGRANYFVSVLAPETYATRWSLGLADLDSPLTGDFVLGPLVVESVSATALEDSAVVGMTVVRPLSLAPHGEAIPVGAVSMGLVAKRNSAGGLECLAR